MSNMSLVQKDGHLHTVLFEYGGKIYFLKNLATRTGSEFGDRRERNEMAALLRNLRGNRYEYCTFYSQKKDIFEFFDWLRKNKYTLEIQGDLFDFADDRSHVDFHGNVCEYSAVFHYRIYSRGFLAISLTSYAP